MLDRRLTVVISEGQSRNPEKRALEQSVAQSLAEIPGISVVVVPHLYDLPYQGTSLSKLRTFDGDMVVITWLFERAAHWVLDRGGVQGQTGEVLLVRPDEDDEEQADDMPEEDKSRVTDMSARPNRQIFCIDFRVAEQNDAIVNEVRRILTDITSDVSSTNDDKPEKPKVSAEALARFQQPTNDTALPLDLSSGTPTLKSDSDSAGNNKTLFGELPIQQIEEHPGRRWYPVIDYSRCTNCMECIDFCLFGVYGVDRVETILVEQPDNCRKGCPACSRVCPENAIIFPQHKTPAIAGAPIEAGGFKIDLSKLFGAPEKDEDAIAAAARERDEQLILAGRQAVGLEVGSRTATSTKPTAPKDDLDNLLDELDLLDL